jgi:hypothetical protein
LRFEKEAYTNGEPVVATMLVRNISGVLEENTFTARVVAERDGSRLKRNDDTGLIRSGPFRVLQPQTQARYQESLNRVYDLTPGEYTFWATSGHSLPSSGKVKITIRN